LVVLPVFGRLSSFLFPHLGKGLMTGSDRKGDRRDLKKGGRNKLKGCPLRKKLGLPIKVSGPYPFSPEVAHRPSTDSFDDREK